MHRGVQMADVTDSTHAPTRPVVQSRKATDWEKFLLSVGRESFRQTVTSLNDVLQRLIVLDTALLGGFVGIKELPMPDWARLLAALGFVVSLGLAFFGVYPAKWGARLNDPVAIKEIEVAIANRKAGLLRWSAGSLIAGFVLGLAGIAWRVFQ